MGVEEQDVVSPDTSTQIEDVAAESSPAPSVEEPDFLTVARSVIDNTEESEGDEPEISKAADDQSDALASQADDEEPQEEQAEPDDENFSDAPFHNHPRFKKLIAQRNEFRTGHQEYQKIQSYLIENGLSNEEAAEGFEVMALLKRDPEAAWARLKPIVQSLLVATGSVLPDDLKARVQQGELTRDAALEMSRLRAGKQALTQQQQLEQQRQAYVQQHQAQQAIRTEVANWEQSMRQRDPDLEAKFDAIEGHVLKLHRVEGQPRTPAEARNQLERAYEAANKMFASVQPRRPERKPVIGGRVSGSPQASAPASMEDVVRKALETSRG